MDKQDIVKEIKRTTKENDGIPLGTQRFAKETGIKKSDWYGIHWSSWGEALNEAGFQPNEYQKAYDESWLIETFIGIIRKLGEWPTRGKLSILCQSNGDLPNSKTFWTRLGKRNEIAKKVLSYCLENDGHEDIIEICTPLISSTAATVDKSPNPESYGFVYLMKSGKYHKIGRSNSVGRREYDIGIKLPEELVVIHEIKTDDPKGIEAYWHKRFAAKRRGGEWFELNASDVRAFKRWRRIY